MAVDMMAAPDPARDAGRAPPHAGRPGERRARRASSAEHVERPGQRRPRPFLDPAPEGAG